MATSLVGQVIMGEYRVDAFIASGGMAVVYRVWDLKRNVSLAMKVLHLELAEDPAVFKLFRREARALQKLTHPNIVDFYGLKETEDFFFLLEKYIDGSPLKAILRQRGRKPLPTQEVLIYLKAISSALGYAHAHGVVHCDVKPGNVMIDQGGAIYLSDFGIARHSESTATTIGMAGTLQYMAPEQFLEEPVSAQTDVYALGVMMYEMLTGQHPFRASERGTERGSGTGSARMRNAHLHITPPEPRELNPGLPEALSEAVMKALAKNPSDRFSGVRDLYLAACRAVGVGPDQVPDRATLKPELGPQPQGVAPVLPDMRKPIPVPGEAILPAGKPAPRKSALPWIIGGAGVLVVGLIFAGLLIAFLSGGGGLGTDDLQLPTRAGGFNLATAAAQTVAAYSASQGSQMQPTVPPQSPPGTSPPTSASTPTRVPWEPWSACTGAPYSRISVGMHVMVSYDPPLANRVRRQPNTSSEILGLIEPGDRVDVIDGPACANNWVWWKIRSSWGLIGWTAEGDTSDYWLVPPE